MVAVDQGLRRILHLHSEARLMHKLNTLYFSRFVQRSNSARGEYYRSGVIVFYSNPFLPITRDKSIRDGGSFCQDRQANPSRPK